MFCYSQFVYFCRLSNSTNENDYWLKQFEEDGGFFDENVNSAQAPVLDLSPLLQLFNNKAVMGNLEALLRDSYKFLRLADDLHEITSYINHMRICFIALTVSGYVGVLIYAFILICRRKKPRDQQSSRQNAQRNATLLPDYESRDRWSGLHSVKTDPVQGYRGSYRQPGLRHHQMEMEAKMNSVDGDVVKQLLVPNDTTPALAKDTLGPPEEV